MTKMPDEAADFEAKRAKLRQNKAVQFVSADEFYALMVSNSMLQRSDLPDANLTGLYNIETGITFVIETELLDTDRNW